MGKRITMPVYPPTQTIGGITYLCCQMCGKTVSSGLLPRDGPETPAPAPKVWAWIACQECRDKLQITV
jgi:hypothetical protein